MKLQEISLFSRSHESVQFDRRRMSSSWNLTQWRNSRIQGTSVRFDEREIYHFITWTTGHRLGDRDFFLDENSLEKNMKRERWKVGWWRIGCVVWAVEQWHDNVEALISLYITRRRIPGNRNIIFTRIGQLLLLSKIPNVFLNMSSCS